MRQVVVNEFLSLDGVAQAPGGADEDRDGGFGHGGWHMPYMDEVGGQWVTDSLQEAGAFLLGRRTYQIFASYWPNAPEEQQVAAKPLNSMPKYVASTTLEEPLAWQNSKLLGPDIAAGVTALKQMDAGDLHVIGSTRLVQSLIDYGLVDEFRLMIDPLVIGGGKRIFRDNGVLRLFELVDSRVTSTGVVLTRYRVKA